MKAPNAKTTRGFTLAEMVIAMSILSIIALTVAGAAMALSDSYSQATGYGDSVQIARTTMRYLQSLIVNAQMITCAGPTYFVVWRDANNDGLFNVSEITTIEYNSATKSILEYRVGFPATWDAATLAAWNASMPLAQVNVLSAIHQWMTVQYSPYQTVTTLADDVTGFTVYGEKTGTANKWLETTVRAGSGTRTFTLTSGAALP